MKETKEQLIHRLYEFGYITFEEVLILQRDTIAVPNVNLQYNLNSIYTEAND